MAKISLGVRPKNFKATITFALLDGTEGALDVSYKYRDRVEFAQLIDEIRAAGLKAAEDEAAALVGTEDNKGKPFSMTDLVKKTLESNSDYVLDVIDWWSLDEPLNVENVKALATVYPLAISTLLEKYRLASTEGRLGN